MGKRIWRKRSGQSLPLEAVVVTTQQKGGKKNAGQSDLSLKSPDAASTRPSSTAADSMGTMAVAG